MLTVATAAVPPTDIADECLDPLQHRKHTMPTILCINMVGEWKSETVKLSFIYRIQRCVHKTSLRTHGRKPKYLTTFSLLLASWFGSVRFGLKFTLSKITPSTRKKVTVPLQTHMHRRESIHTHKHTLEVICVSSSR